MRFVITHVAQQLAFGGKIMEQDTGYNPQNKREKGSLGQQ